MADSKEKLFSDFPGVSTEAWMEKITADRNSRKKREKNNYSRPERC